VNLDDLAFLTSPRGEALLDRVRSADLGIEALLPLLESLRAAFTPAEKAAAIELTRMRRAAVEKFGADSARLYFSSDALEQASHPGARQWRVESAAALTPARILDVCCGIGADSLAFATLTDTQVTGIDLDPARVAIARLNADVLHSPVQFAVGDARRLDPAAIADADLIFFDPARRDARGRSHHVEQGDPPLSTIRAWGEKRIWAKLSPGVQIDQIAPYLDMGAGLDFIAVDGALKEALLRLHDDSAVSRRAVMWIDDTLHTLVTDPSALAPIGEIRAWLCEPDPAIIRAGAVGQVAIAAQGSQIDRQIAYFMTDSPPDVPYVRAWRVREWLPFNLKKLRALLRSRGIVRVTVKKRGSAVTPETLIAQLKLPGGKGESCTLVLTRWRDRPIVIVCDEMPIGSSG